jgi:multiple sugar transport system ATP-binding protein
MAEVRLSNVTKNFGKFTIEQLNLIIKHKEFLVIVGPSGCGKSTTLRMIAGLEEVTEGDIYIDERNVTDIPPKDRDVAMVFQNYALYPHLSVYENMAFGLMLRKIKKSEIEKQVIETAQMLGIKELLNSKPKELSGGQRQRVAMGRAIVRNPLVFLFDEPLSNLDAKLRVQMRVELAKLHNRLEGTILYVTHDQTEAMTLAQRIVIMNKGEVMQIGSPMDVYYKPKNLFVAGFIGSPGMNLINSYIVQEKDSIFIVAENQKLAVPEHLKSRFSRAIGREVFFGIRPEHFFDSNLKKSFHGCEKIRVKVDVVEPLGSDVFIVASFGSTELSARLDAKTELKSSDQAELFMDMNQMHLFEKETEMAY